MSLFQTLSLLYLGRNSKCCLRKYYKNISKDSNVVLYNCTNLDQSEAALMRWPDVKKKTNEELNLDLHVYN